ncbi:MAG: hypothetical protein ABWY00_02475, partial [Dongiaceae bacterium]
QATIMARPTIGIGKAAAQLNHQIALSVLRGEKARGALAGQRLGGGLPCSDNDFVAISMIQQLGRNAPTERWADALGMPPQSPERQSFVELAANRYRQQASVWKNLGMI